MATATLTVTPAMIAKCYPGPLGILSDLDVVKQEASMYVVGGMQMTPDKIDTAVQAVLAMDAHGLVTPAVRGRLAASLLRGYVMHTKDARVQPLQWSLCNGLTKKGQQCCDKRAAGSQFCYRHGGAR